MGSSGSSILSLWFQSSCSLNTQHEIHAWLDHQHDEVVSHIQTWIPFWECIIFFFIVIVIIIRLLILKSVILDSLRDSDSCNSGNISGEEGLKNFPCLVYQERQEREYSSSNMCVSHLEIKQSMERKSVSCDEESEVAKASHFWLPLVFVIHVLLFPITVIISCSIIIRWSLRTSNKKKSAKGVNGRRWTGIQRWMQVEMNREWHSLLHLLHRWWWWLHALQVTLEVTDRTTWEEQETGCDANMDWVHQHEHLDWRVNKEFGVSNSITVMLHQMFQEEMKARSLHDHLVLHLLSSLVEQQHRRRKKDRLGTQTE